ncbi:MAG: universal stress protein [Negativicutes bacterium]
MNTQKIVVAYDGSPGSDKALQIAVDLARALKAHIHMVSVIDLSTLEASAIVASGEYDFEQLELDLKAASEEIIAVGRKRCEESGLPATTSIVRGNPADEIIKLAHKERAYMIVAGSRGKGGFERLLLGSVAQALVAHSDIPVLIAK